MIEGKESFYLKVTDNKDSKQTYGVRVIILRKI